MGPRNPLGRLRVHLRLQMAGMCTLPMDKHGNLVLCPMPVVGAPLLGRVDKLGLPWDSRPYTSRILGHTSSAPPITFPRVPVRELLSTTSSALSQGGMVVHFTRVWTTGRLGRYMDKTSLYSTTFNIGTIFNHHSTNSGFGMGLTRKEGVVLPTSRSLTLRVISQVSVDKTSCCVFPFFLMICLSLMVGISTMSVSSLTGLNPMVRGPVT